jgi:type I restriction enzyme S subunit
MKEERLSSIVVALESGSRPKGGVKGIRGGVLSIGAEHLDGEGGFDFSKPKRIPRDYYYEMKKGHVSCEDILVVKDGATTGKTSFISTAFPDELAAVNEHVFIVRVDATRACPAYVFRYLQSPHGRLQVLADFRGATVGGISRGFVERVRIPLPPLPEQRRIAAILDKADAIRRKRQQTLDLADQFLRSAFLDMFGDPVTNPKGWKTARLGDVCSRITDGTHQPPVWSEEGYPFLFVSNIVNGAISFETKKHISEETWRELTRRCPIEMNDILYTTVGSYGNSALVDTKRRFAFQRHIAHIKPDVSLIHPEFLVGMLQSPAVRVQADRAVKGIAQKTLNLGDLKVFKIFVPPRDAQEMYVGPRRRALEQRLSAVSALACADELGNSLVQRAFRGEL